MTRINLITFHFVDSFLIFFYSLIFFFRITSITTMARFSKRGEIIKKNNEKILALLLFLNSCVCNSIKKKKSKRGSLSSPAICLCLYFKHYSFKLCFAAFPPATEYQLESDDWNGFNSKSSVLIVSCVSFIQSKGAELSNSVSSTLCLECNLATIRIALMAKKRQK